MAGLNWNGRRLWIGIAGAFALEYAHNGSGVVAMFFDEAQRYCENEYEWLRDGHDHLDRINIRLFIFLIGQEELHAVKTGGLKLEVQHLQPCKVLPWKIEEPTTS